MSEIVDIRYVINSDEVTADSRAVDKAVHATQKTVETASQDMRENIAIQKQVLKDLEKQYRELEKVVKQTAPGAAQVEMQRQLFGAKAEIEAERKALVELTKAQATHEQSTVSLRTQIMNLRNAMATMVEGTDEYNTAMLKLGALQDKMGNIQQQGRVYADDEKYFRTTTEAVQGLAGAMSVGVGVASLFGASQENLAKIQTKLQAVMAISIGVQQVAQVLNKDSYVSHILLTKVKTIHTAVQAKLTAALWGSAAAAKAVSIALTGGLVVAVWAIVAAFDAWSSAEEQRKQKAEEVAKAQKEYESAIVSGVSKQIVAYNKLQKAWTALGDNLKSKEKFIANNKDEFTSLGVSVSNVTQAENVLVANTDTMIAALMARARAAAAMELATAKYKEIFEAEQNVKNIEPQVAKSSPLNKAGGMSLTGSIEGAELYASTMHNKEQERLDEQYKAEKANAQKIVDEKKHQYEEFINISVKANQDYVNQIDKMGGGTPHAGGDKSTPDLSKAARERQIAIVEAEIEAMNEGKAKKLAQIDLNYRREKQKLAEQKEQQLKDAKGNKPQTEIIESDFGKLNIAANQKHKRDRLAVMRKENNAMLDELIKGIEKQGQAELDQIIENNANAQAARVEYLSKYGDLEQKKLAITLDYAARIAAAKTESEKKLLTKDRDMDIAQVDMAALKAQAPFKVLFDDLDKFGAGTINKAITAARTLLDAASASGKYTAQDLKVMCDALSKAEAVVRDRNPFVALGKAIKDWDEKDPKKSFTNLAQGAADSFSLVSECLGTVVSGLKEMGLAGDQETERILDQSIKLIGGVGDVAAGLASMNPAQMLQGAMAIFTSLWDLLDSRSRNARIETERLNGEIEKSKLAYEELGYKIEKAFGSSASAMHEEQAAMLERQKMLVEQQKIAELSKKNPDDSAIKEYDKQIRDLGRQVDESKEKAVDAIFGSDIQSAVNDFASAYVNAYAAGEDRAKSQKDIVRKMIQGMVGEIIKSNIAGHVEKLRTTLKSAIIDGVISETEEAAIDKLQQEIYDQSERDAKAYDKWLTGDDDKKEKDEGSLAGQIRGTAATEQSVAELGGIFRGQHERLSSIDRKMDLGITQLFDIARTNLLIEVNTRRTADNTDGLRDTVGEVGKAIHATNERLEQVIRNTKLENGTN